jgi:hypothetical protein
MHFLALGALLFVAHRLWVGDYRPEQRIVVARELKAELAREFRARHGRDPAPPELHAAVEKWKADEVAYREGLRLGLDKNDPLVRERIVTKLHEIEGKLRRVREPSDAELDAFLAANRARYELPPRYDFEHYFAANRDQQAEARARAIASELEAGRTPDDVGDEFPEGRQLMGRSEAEVSRVFGETFARGLAGLEVGRWTLLASRLGVHVVRLQAATPRVPADRERLRSELVRDWQLAEREKAAASVPEALGSAYVFVEEP